MQRIELVYLNAGGGHRAAAEALAESMDALGRRWQIERVNLTELLDPGGSLRRSLGFEPEALYNKQLANGFTLGLAQELKLLQAVIRVAHSRLVGLLAAHWRANRPDLVVSLIPNFNLAMHDALAAARPAAPFVTVLTDLADHPPHFWIEPQTRQHVVCGTAQAVAQALVAGCDPTQVHEVSGMLLRPGFYSSVGPLDRAAARRCLGLDEHAPVGLVLFGGMGSRAMERIAARLPDSALVLMCGRNEALAERLRRQPARAPRVVVGYTSEVPYWMRLADYFIGKPGPGSLSEAVHMGLPVIVTRNTWTMPQERWNTEWVREHGVGLVERSFRTVDRAVGALTARLPEFKKATQRLHNRALFEVPWLLESILDGHVAPVQRTEPLEAVELV